MITELERHQGVVLRQIVSAAPFGVQLRTANETGRNDAFLVSGAAIQIKYSSKRLSPWRFTYTAENLQELRILRERHGGIWVFLCCGSDGVVCLSFDELETAISLSQSESTQWVAIARSRAGMYRVSGSAGALNRAKARGVDQFVRTIITQGGRES